MEIKNKAYYKLDGYKSFEKFIKDYIIYWPDIKHIRI